MKRFLFLSLFLLMTTPVTAEMLSVIHQPAELRAQPYVARTKVLAELPRFAPLEVLEKSAEYYKVKDHRGQVGYIHRSLVGSGASLVITADVCNIRSGPGTEHAIVFKAMQGDSFRVLNKQGEWLEIVSSQGKTGWVWQNLTWGY
ncbi:MAG TPA: SH3 domain-containing protein [Malonomonas sp.]